MQIDGALSIVHAIRIAYEIAFISFCFKVAAKGNCVVHRLKFYFVINSTVKKNSEQVDSSV